MPTRDNAISTGYKLEWSRLQQMRVTDFLAWQAALVREYRRPDQFVMQDFAAMMRPTSTNSRSPRYSTSPAPTHITARRTTWTAPGRRSQGDYIRSLRHQNYLVTETNAQTIGWDSASQYPPYDGQIRLDVYTDISSGANMVEYWHWHSIHPGRRSTGRACSATTSSPTAPTPKSRAPHMNCRRSARSSST